MTNLHIHESHDIDNEGLWFVEFVLHEVSGDVDNGLDYNARLHVDMNLIVALAPRSMHNWRYTSVFIAEIKIGDKHFYNYCLCR